MNKICRWGMRLVRMIDRYVTGTGKCIFRLRSLPKTLPSCRFCPLEGVHVARETHLDVPVDLSPFVVVVAVVISVAFRCIS